MSQLERALRKAHAEGGGASTATGSADQDARQGSKFVSPWEFEEPVDLFTPAESGSAQPPSSESRQAVPSSSRLEGFNQAIREKLVVGESASDQVREQFRKLAASLYRVRETHPLKVVMIVSAVPGEGKTLTATNLALTLSESYGSQVLLLDADLRRPTLHDVFGIPNTSGLREGLTSGNGRVVSPVRISAHLEVLTAGKAAMDPMSALISDRLRSILDQAAAAYDWVLIDTPPVDLLPDAKLLTNAADGAILVVQAGSTRCQQAQRAVEAIGRERIVGVVLNQLTSGMGDADYKHYGYYADEPIGHPKQ